MEILFYKKNGDDPYDYNGDTDLIESLLREGNCTEQYKFVVIEQVGETRFFVGYLFSGFQHVEVAGTVLMQNEGSEFTGAGIFNPKQNPKFSWDSLSCRKSDRYKRD